jgi:hypothetical protein
MIVILYQFEMTVIALFYSLNKKRIQCLRFIIPGLKIIATFDWLKLNFFFNKMCDLFVLVTHLMFMN